MSLLTRLENLVLERNGRVVEKAEELANCLRSVANRQRTPYSRWKFSVYSARKIFGEWISSVYIVQLSSAAFIAPLFPRFSRTVGDDILLVTVCKGSPRPSSVNRVGFQWARVSSRRRHSKVLAGQLSQRSKGDGSGDNVHQISDFVWRSAKLFTEYKCTNC